MYSFVCKFMRFLRKRSLIVSPLTTVIENEYRYRFQWLTRIPPATKTHVLYYQLFSFLGLFLQCFWNGNLLEWGLIKDWSTNYNKLYAYSVMLKVNDYKVSKICGNRKRPLLISFIPASMGVKKTETSNYPACQFESLSYYTCRIS